MRSAPRTLWKVLGSLVSVCIGLVVGEVALRYYFDVVSYKRTATIDRIQKYLEPRPEIGYVWRPNVDYNEHISLNWADQDAEHAILSTDECGFRNHPGAIAERRAHRPPDVVAVGDSFMEMAARPLYEFFKGRGLSFHDFAMHRMCTPQYNIILDRYALPLHPRFVIYGVFENDFYELPDYQAWRQSGLDWFAYHSGYWCGPAIGESRLLRPKGYLALYQALMPGSYAERRAQSIIDAALKDVCSDVLAANGLCARAGARLLVLLIPGKETLFHGLKRPARCFDQIGRLLNEKGIAVIDLRPVILAHPQPRLLYYRVDGHWNPECIRLVAGVVYDRLVEMGASSRPASAPAATSAGRQPPH
jgi:hypothetical protein